MIVLSCGRSGLKLDDAQLKEYEEAIRQLYPTQEVIAVPYWLKYSHEHSVFHYGEPGTMPTLEEIKAWHVKLQQRMKRHFAFLPYHVSINMNWT